MFEIDYNSYRTTGGWNSRIRYLVLHYTAANFQTSVAALAGKFVSAHYLVPDPTDPTYRAAGFSKLSIFNLVDEKDRAWHAGASAWETRNNLNDTAIGIEIVNVAVDSGGVFTFPDYHPEQLAAITQLSRNILQRYPDITPTRVVGHSDISYTRKSDPGPRFPWEALHQSGIGAWYDSDEKAVFMERFSRDGVPPRGEMIRAFRTYGYDVADTISERHFVALIRAFQMHFRPTQYEGKLDVETAACLFALNRKYKKT